MCHQTTRPAQLWGNSFQEKGCNGRVGAGMQGIEKTFKASADVCQVHFPKPSLLYDLIRQEFSAAALRPDVFSIVMQCTSVPETQWS